MSGLSSHFLSTLMVPHRVDIASTEGLLLLGGGSERFGSDKLLTDVGGEPLFVRPLRALGGVVSHINLSVRGPNAHMNVPGDLCDGSISVILDPETQVGPLGGIAASLAERSVDQLVLAGDLPMISADVLNLLVEVARDIRADVVCARAKESGRAQPLCGVWRVTVGRQIEAYLADGNRGVFGFLDLVDVHFVDVADRELVNINRPGDLDLLAQMY